MSVLHVAGQSLLRFPRRRKYLLFSTARDFAILNLTRAPSIQSFGTDCSLFGRQTWRDVTVKVRSPSALAKYLCRPRVDGQGAYGRRKITHRAKHEYSGGYGLERSWEGDHRISETRCIHLIRVPVIGHVRHVLSNNVLPRRSYFYGHSDRARVSNNNTPPRTQPTTKYTTIAGPFDPTFRRFVAGRFLCSTYVFGNDRAVNISSTTIL